MESVKYLDQLTLNKAFRLSIVADIVLSLVIVTNCISFYPRIRRGPTFIVRQVWLIAFSAIFMICRDMTIIQSTLGKEATSIIASIFQIMYTFTNTIMYWLFTFKYWTVSLDFKDLESYRHKTATTYSKNGSERPLMNESQNAKFTLTSFSAQRPEDQDKNKSPRVKYRWISVLYILAIVGVLVAWVVMDIKQPMI